MFSNIKNIVLIVLCAFVCGTHNLNYSDMQTLGISCPERDSCDGYRNNLSYSDRSCECDLACSSYKDCCIDALRRRNTGRTPSRNNLRCLNYGDDRHSGVYAVSTCKSNWNGLREVREKCVGPVDFSDPLAAAPLTNIAQGMTYRNLFCAECNNANMASLTTFQIRMACEGLQGLPEEQIMGDLVYNSQLGSWGVYRLNNFGNGTNFIGCAIIFDVPPYLNNSVRFCRSNIISRCAPDWTRPVIKRHCDDYMAVVYDNKDAYRNPHCAICNHRTVDDVKCRIGVISRKRPMSFALLLDVNQSDGDQVGMRRVPTPECPSNHKYDPFFKKCRLLVCALPGHVVVDGKCVKS